MATHTISLSNLLGDATVKNGTQIRVTLPQSANVKLSQPVLGGEDDGFLDVNWLPTRRRK